MNIFATLTNGSQVFHGTLHERQFRRFLLENDVNTTDRCFMLNTSVIPILLENNCNTLEFLWMKKNIKQLFTISFLQAAKKYKPYPNKNGEENIHIPIDDCILVPDKKI